MSLTNKQKAFIEHYLETWNATEAARRAGYKGNYNTLGVVGFENVRKPKIAEAIKKRLAEKAMSADEVLSRLADQARASVADFISDDDGEIDLVAVKKMGHLVKSVTRTRQGLKLELHDAQAALVHIGRHHALFKDKVEHSWREEAEREGVDPDAIYNDLVAQFTSAMVGKSSSGGVGGSEEAS